MIWVLVFSDFSRLMEEALRDHEYFKAHCVEWRIYIYADDVAILIAHNDAEVVAKAANIMKVYIDTSLAALKLALSIPKCYNMLLSPREIVGVHYRRNNGLSTTTNKELPARDIRLKDLLDTFTEDRMPAGVCPPSLKHALPYHYKTDFKILGVQFDQVLGFKSHVEQTFRRAGVRQGIMASLAKRSWGLEVGILRSTHQALISSLMA